MQIPSFHGAFRDTAVSCVQFGLQIWHAGTHITWGRATEGIGLFGLGQEVGAGTRVEDHGLERIMPFPGLATPSQV